MLEIFQQILFWCRFFLAIDNCYSVTLKHSYLTQSCPKCLKIQLNAGVSEAIAVSVHTQEVNLYHCIWHSSALQYFRGAKE